MNDLLWSEIEPFYFGELEKQLFGCHHLPGTTNSRSCSVVLCYPTGQEYIRSHRAFYQLSIRLAGAGFHVLRFDYFGSGDSYGNYEEASIQQWMSDIQTGIEEIKKRSGANSICLIGLRMGAALALKATSYSQDVKSTVLWEPVLDGKRYLEEIKNTQQRFFGDNLLRGGQEPHRSAHDEEILGFLITAKMKEDIKRVKVDQLEPYSNGRLLVLFNSGETARVSGLHGFAQRHPCVDIQVIDDYREWEFGPVRRPPLTTLKYIVKWVDRAHS